MVGLGTWDSINQSVYPYTALLMRMFSALRRCVYAKQHGDGPPLASRIVFATIL